MGDWSGHTVTRPILDDVYSKSEANVNEEAQEFDGQTPELLSYLDTLDHEIIALMHKRHRLSAFLNKRTNDQFDILNKINSSFHEKLSSPQPGAPF